MAANRIRVIRFIRGFFVIDSVGPPLFALVPGSGLNDSIAAARRKTVMVPAATLDTNGNRRRGRQCIPSRALRQLLELE